MDSSNREQAKQTNEQYYSRNGMGEGRPGEINSEECGRTEVAKTISATGRLQIDQSQLGHDMGQTPADEHIDHRFSQIDDDTRQMRCDGMERTIAKEFDTEDFRRVDERDNEDSTEDWDAEKSRTGRHK